MFPFPAAPTAASSRPSPRRSPIVPAAKPARPHNDATRRADIWRRWPGDEWACFDALPPAIRQRLQAHAYDPWATNALRLWRLFLRQTGSGARAERRLLRHLDRCEALEREAFAAAYRAAHGRPLPHDAAAASILRAGRRCA